MAAVGCPACGRTIDSVDATCKWCGVNLAMVRSSAPQRVADEMSLMMNMTDAQRALFVAEMATRRESRSTALVLTLFLGGVGAHHFYLGRVGLGVLYAVFVWTFIPAIIALFELFVIGDRVDRYNLSEAHLVAARINAMGPGRTA